MKSIREDCTQCHRLHLFAPIPPEYPQLLANVEISQAQWLIQLN